MSKRSMADDSNGGVMSRSPLFDFDRRISLGFGALVLLLMIIVSVVSVNGYRQTAKANEATLTTALSGILGDTINRTSVSGRYHTRLLLEQLTGSHPELDYIYVVGADGLTIAHSDPNQNGQALPEALKGVLQQVLDGEAVPLSLAAASGGVREIVLPYRVGFEEQIGGMIVAGLSFKAAHAPIVHYRLLVIGLIGTLTVLSLVATYLISRWIAGPVKQMARLHHGLLKHAPLYIGIFDREGRITDSSATYQSLIRSGLAEDDSPFKAPLDSAAVYSDNGIDAYEKDYRVSDDKRTAMVVSFPVSVTRTGDVEQRCAIATDVTEQRRAELALREHRDLLERTIEQRTADLRAANSSLRRRSYLATRLGQLKELLLGEASFQFKVDLVTEYTTQLLGARSAGIWLAERGDRCHGGCMSAESSRESYDCVAKEWCLHLASHRGLVPECGLPVLERIPSGISPVGVFVRRDESGSGEHDAAPAGNDPEFGPFAGEGLHCSAIELKTALGRPAGVLAVWCAETLPADDLVVLEELATIASYVVQAKRAADELQEANATLLRSERLAALGELTATVSHELRNPLGTIQASCYLIKSRLEGGIDEKIGQALERVNRSILRCDLIIEALLDFAREQNLSTEPTDAGTWLREELEDYTIPDGVRLETEIAEDCRALLDRQILYQCLTNVLNNACDAVMEDISHQPEKDHYVRVALGREDGEIVLTIADSGTGIDAENQKRIFEPLFSTKGFGTGLGLPLVRRLLETHGGRVEVESTPRVGTTVRMRFPG